MCIYTNGLLFIYIYILMGDYLCVYILMVDYIFTVCLKHAKKTNNCIFVCMMPFLELKNS